MRPFYDKSGLSAVLAQKSLDNTAVGAVAPTCSPLRRRYAAARRHFCQGGARVFATSSQLFLESHMIPLPLFCLFCCPVFFFCTGSGPFLYWLAPRCAWDEVSRSARAPRGQIQACYPQGLWSGGVRKQLTDGVRVPIVGVGSWARRHALPQEGRPSLHERRDNDVSETMMSRRKRGTDRARAGKGLDEGDSLLAEAAADLYPKHDDRQRPVLRSSRYALSWC